MGDAETDVKDSRGKATPLFQHILKEFNIRFDIFPLFFVLFFLALNLLRNTDTDFATNLSSVLQNFV